MRRYLGFLGPILIATATVASLFGSPRIPHPHLHDLGVVSAKVPVYPKAYTGTLGQVDISGEVQVNVQVDNTGLVTSAMPVSGRAPFRAYAANAAMHWRFTPVQGAPIRNATLTFVFSIAPHDASDEELTPTFEPPYKVEVKQRALKSRKESVR